MRTRHIAATALLSALTLVGCSNSIDGTASPAGAGPAATQPGGTGGSAPSAESAPSAPSAAKPSMTMADFATIEVPAYCDVPAHRLVDFEVAMGEAEGGIGQAAEPLIGLVEPVLVDLDGDGAVEGVSVYSCTAGGTAIWPSLILLNGPDGVLIDYVDLGELSGKSSASVDQLTVEGGKVTVSWHSSAGNSGDQSDHVDALTYDGSTLTLGDGLGIDTSSLDLAPYDGGDFASPTGGLTCAIHEIDGVTGAYCDATAGAYENRPSWQEICPDSGGNIGPSWIVVEAQAGWACAGGIAAWPVYQDWNLSGFGTQIMKDGYTLDVLPYGKSLRLDEITCSMAETGVTCKNALTGAGFSLNKAGVQFF